MSFKLSYGVHMAKPIGANIRRKRVELGMETKQLAAAIDRSVKTVQNLESGSNTATPEVLYRIAKVLKMPIEQVMDSDWVAPIEVDQTA